MEPGFIVDEGYGTRTVAKWIAGEPETSMWTGLELAARTSTTLQLTAAGAAAISKATPDPHLPLKLTLRHRR